MYAVFTWHSNRCNYKDAPTEATHKTLQCRKQEKFLFFLWVTVGCDAEHETHWDTYILLKKTCFIIQKIQWSHQCQIFHRFTGQRSDKKQQVEGNRSSSLFLFLHMLVLELYTIIIIISIIIYNAAAEFVIVCYVVTILVIAVLCWKVEL